MAYRHHTIIIIRNGMYKQEKFLGSQDLVIGGWSDRVLSKRAIGNIVY